MKRADSFRGPLLIRPHQRHAPRRSPRSGWSTRARRSGDPRWAAADGIMSLVHLAHAAGSLVWKRTGWIRTHLIPWQERSPLLAPAATRWHSCQPFSSWRRQYSRPRFGVRPVEAGPALAGDAAGTSAGSRGGAENLTTGRITASTARRPRRYAEGDVVSSLRHARDGSERPIAVPVPAIPLARFARSATAARSPASLILVGGVTRAGLPGTCARRMAHARVTAAVAVGQRRSASTACVLPALTLTLA